MKLMRLNSFNSIIITLLKSIRLSRFPKADGEKIVTEISVSGNFLHRQKIEFFVSPKLTFFFDERKYVKNKVRY